MDFDQLFYFQIVAKHQSLTKASEELNLSQPALSRSILRLEEEIGVPLLERKSRGVVLNQYGRVFLSHANQVLSEMKEAKLTIHDMVDPHRGTISLAFIQTLGSSFVPDLISEFQKEFPNIQFQLSQNISSEILKEIHTANIDIGFCSPQEPHDDMCSIPVLREELFLIVPAAHRLAGTEQVNLSEVADDPFILFKPQTALHDLIENLCNEAGFLPRKVFEGYEERTVSDLVGANFGVAIVPYIPNLDESKISMIRLQSPKCFRVIQLVWRLNGYMSPAVTNFKEFVERRAFRV
ncbi:LysR family transcriptional regulator [Bacillus salipaludis]|uniref:LysR family transcriptional regulator n=1 Tax=Bacillus salipaludis TaxID=2547811 RepID=A0A4R5VLB4_9BACI|nr:LysR family transcriptional regulator [Bacillus salipaludis]MDQ6597792.1 LysR family transcriptional regulator [Bacillus salipaludis]TDK57357.1 LysR family transcriptional regulator [Bacillus salipaludis]